jgi:hypothetical protein
MKLRILDSALEDLDRGRKFYERQGEGLGVYCVGTFNTFALKGMVDQ